MAINFERLVSRGVARELSRQLDIAEIKMSVNQLLGIIIFGFFAIFIGIAVLLTLLKEASAGVSGLIGLAAAVFLIVLVYSYIAYKTDSRKSKLEVMLPDYFMVAAANLKSGIALDRSLLLAARPEFGFLSEEIKDMNRKVMSGDTLENALREMARRYQSGQLTHTVRMMIDAMRYGGAMADLLEQLSKDMRSQQIVQKEIAGQLLMYSIFIAFAGLIAAPGLFGLTSQMIVIVDKVWNGILTTNPGGLPTAGISFLKPSPPQITIQEYTNFAIVSIIIISGFASIIMSTISTGSAVRGLKYLPIFIIGGVTIFFISRAVMAAILGSAGI
jgi:archaeal flagellar protein FlaJ